MRYLLFALVFACACATTEVATRDATSTEGAAASEVAHLANLYDFAEALNALPSIAQQSISHARAQQTDAPLPASIALALQKTRQEFTSAFVLSAMEGVLERDKVALKSVQRYLVGEAHRAVLDRTAFVASPAGQRALGLFLGSLAKRPVDSERLARARLLSEANGEAELFAILSLEAVPAYIERVKSHTPMDDRVVYGGLELDKKAFRARTDRTLRLQTYFITTLVEDRHVIRELAFWRSPAGQWLRAARLDALRAAVATTLPERGQQ